MRSSNNWNPVRGDENCQIQHYNIEPNEKKKPGITAGSSSTISFMAKPSSSMKTSSGNEFEVEYASHIPDTLDNASIIEANWRTTRAICL
jgi:hypothetical protein